MADLIESGRHYYTAKRYKRALELFTKVSVGAIPEAIRSYLSDMIFAEHRS